VDKRLLDPPELSDDVIALARIAEDDFPQILQTYADEPTLGEALGLDEEPTLEKLAEWAATRDDGVWLKAVDAETRRYLGDIDVSVNWSNARAELAFTTLASERGLGVATRMVSLVRDWLFSEGFLRVQLQTLPTNEASQGVARRAGFEPEGTLRSHFVRRGKALDAVTFGSVNESWKA
jgi:RimJ/RimL family protein N-acetyltransferase